MANFETWKEALANEACDCVGPGWKDLVRDLVRDLFALGWDGELHDVKEKWGGLRFYPGLISLAVEERIEEAEMESLVTCEYCGQPGSPYREGSWVKTLCDTCRPATCEKCGQPGAGATQ